MITGDKRKIKFQITIGSRWEASPFTWYKTVTPVGGTYREVIVEFIQQTGDSFKEACDLLRDIVDDTYHIWYWSWLD